MEVRHFDSTDSNQTGQFQNLILLHQGFMQGLGLVCRVATGLMLLIDDAIKPQVRNNSQLCFCPNAIVFVLTIFLFYYYLSFKQEITLTSSSLLEYNRSMCTSVLLLLVPSVVARNSPFVNSASSYPSGQRTWLLIFSDKLRYAVLYLYCASL